MFMDLLSVYREYGDIINLNEAKKKWDYESVKKEASKYKSRWEFAKGNGSAYDIAGKNGWLDEFDWLVTPERKVKWDYESVKEEASKYKSRKEFEKGNESAYKVALKNGWLDEFFPKN